MSISGESQSGITGKRKRGCATAVISAQRKRISSSCAYFAGKMKVMILRNIQSGDRVFLQTGQFSFEKENRSKKLEINGIFKDKKLG